MKLQRAEHQSVSFLVAAAYADILFLFLHDPSAFSSLLPTSGGTSPKAPLPSSFPPGSAKEPPRDPRRRDSRRWQWRPEEGEVRAFTPPPAAPGPGSLLQLQLSGWIPVTALALDP